MNETTTNIWTKARTGPQALVFWSLTVFSAAILFAGLLTTFLLFVAPENIFIWAKDYPAWVWRTRELVPALIGLKIMALFIMAVGIVCLLLGLFRRFRARDAGALDATENQKKSRQPVN